MPRRIGVLAALALLLLAGLRLRAQPAPAWDEKLRATADAAAIGFDDDFIYQQVPLPPEQRTIRMRPLLRGEALKTFEAWAEMKDKVRY